MRLQVKKYHQYPGEHLYSIFTEEELTEQDHDRILEKQKEVEDKLREIFGSGLIIIATYEKGSKPFGFSIKPKRNRALGAFMTWLQELEI